MSDTTPFEYNKDFERRDTLIFGEVKDYGPGKEHYTYSFRLLTPEKLKTLMDEKFINPDETQNYSPSTQQFYDLMERHCNITAHGYVVSPKRDDYRMTLEGIEAHGIMQDAMQEVLEMCRFADELEFDLIQGTLRAWWD